MRIFRKGQSIIEYTTLIIIIAAALVVMSTYITRSVNARVKQTNDALKLSTDG